MVKLDPELNGGVRSVALTANHYRIDYGKAKNASIRSAIAEMIDTVDFDDFLINALRNLQVYGNDINKLVGRTGVGITAIQSLPIRQITIVDNRGANGLPFTADENSPIMSNDFYILREQGIDQMVFPEVKSCIYERTTNQIGLRTASCVNRMVFGASPDFRRLSKLSV